MAEKKNILTYTGLKKYEDELHDLKVNKRQEIAQKIKEAREQGDLSENAEYDAAKDEQRDIEARIVDLEKLLKNAEVVVEDEIDLDKISIGCQVKVLDVEEDEEMEFKIVGSTEANSLDGKISNESPVGRALLGKKAGETVDVETQAGVIQYKILDIRRVSSVRTVTGIRRSKKRWQIRTRRISRNRICHQLLKVRREKLAELQACRQGPVPDYKI